MRRAAGALDRLDRLRLGGQRLLELAAGAEPERREHLVKVVLDGARADEQPRADLRIRQALASEPRDLRLLGRELVTGLGGALAGGLAGRQQLARRAVGERLGADRAEELVCGAELGPRLEPAPAPAQPLAVEQLGPGMLRPVPGSAQAVDRLSIQPLRGFSLADLRTRTRLDAEGPVRAAEGRPLLELSEGPGGELAFAAAD